MTRVFGQPIPAKTTLHLFVDASLRDFWLDRDAEIQGHFLRAQHDGIGQQLYPNGQLRVIELARDESIDGVPCTSRRNPFRLGVAAFINGDNARVRFHPNGRLEQCRISRTSTIDGRVFKAGQVVRLRPDGRVEPALTDRR